MDLKAGSYSAPKGGNLKFYREEEIETNEFLLERVYSGGKLMIRLLVKDVSFQNTIVLLPQGSVDKIYFLRMGMDLKENLLGGNGSPIQISFNNLTIDRVVETHSFIPFQAGQSDELKRLEDGNHTYHRYNGQSDADPILTMGSHPTISDKPLTVDLNRLGTNYSAVASYELLLEFNYYDK